MTGWKTLCFFGLLVASGASNDAKAQFVERSSLSLECSAQADARGLHGQERRVFRSSCMSRASAPAVHSARPPKREAASTKRDNRPQRQKSPPTEKETSVSKESAQGPAPGLSNGSVPAASQPSEAEHRVALVIGNSVYRNVPSLPNPERDAAAVADALKETGFESVTLETNLNRDQLIQALRAFAAQAEKSDWAVIYYAGHGMEVGGINYLIPIDATIGSDRDMSFEAIPLDQILNVAERARKLRLVVLDACRDNPFAARMKRTMSIVSRSVSRGLASVEPDAGTLVVFAAKDGEVALDGDGAHSPFATAFIKDIRVPGLEVRRLFDTVRDDVLDMTRGKQKPFSYGSVSGRQDFYFVQK
jgi:Caspase domain/psiF repeat